MLADDGPVLAKVVRTLGADLPSHEDVLPVFKEVVPVSREARPVVRAVLFREMRENPRFSALLAAGSPRAIPP